MEEIWGWREEKVVSTSLCGVGVLVSFEDKAVEVKFVSECLMMVKIVSEECLIHVSSGYVPQVGWSQLEDAFWNAVYDLLDRL